MIGLSGIALGRCDDCRFGSFFNLELFAELPRDHYLAFYGERDCFRFEQCIHDSLYDIKTVSR